MLSLGKKTHDFKGIQSFGFFLHTESLHHGEGLFLELKKNQLQIKKGGNKIDVSFGVYGERHGL